MVFFIPESQAVLTLNGWHALLTSPASDSSFISSSSMPLEDEVVNYNAFSSCSQRMQLVWFTNHSYSLLLPACCKVSFIFSFDCPTVWMLYLAWSISETLIISSCFCTHLCVGSAGRICFDEREKKNHLFCFLISRVKECCCPVIPTPNKSKVLSFKEFKVRSLNIYYF